VDSSLVLTLCLGMLVAAFLYAAVGHGGASAYIAAMALAGVAPGELRMVALQLNILVSAIASFKFYRAGHFRWTLFWPFAVVSIPCAYLGGAIVLPGHAYKALVGIVLLYAGWQLWWSAGRGEELRPTRKLSVGAAMPIGAGLGLLSGLTGVGGGIFLSPLLLLMGWAGTKQTSAVAALFILVNSAAGLTAGFVRNPVPPPDYAWWLMVAVLLGGYAGAEYGSRRFANPLIRRLLGLVLAVAGMKMLLV
jgi:uncharacterized membrane protein YfcA